MHNIGNLCRIHSPLPEYSRPPFYWSNHSCFQLATFSLYLVRTYQCPASTSLHVERTATYMQQTSVEEYRKHSSCMTTHVYTVDYSNILHVHMYVQYTLTHTSSICLNIYGLKLQQILASSNFHIFIFTDSYVLFCTRDQSNSLQMASNP